jgi:predicted lipoprotein with Yx(FWY)xxD motif
MAIKSSAEIRGRRSGGLFRAGRRCTAGRAVMAGLAAAAAAAPLAACGSAGTGTTAGPGHQAAASHGMAVSARKLPGIGAVLVDRSGKTAYSSQQESDGKILCTGSCLSFWFPVSVAPGTPLRGSSGVTGVLGTIHRSDGGLTQLTYNGKPLYTFRLDQAPGQAHGNNFTDHFGSASFTWHAVTAGETPAGPGRPGPSGGYSYPAGSSGY